MTLQIDDNGSIEKLLNSLPEIKDLFERVLAKKDNELTAEWYDLESCFALRGGGHFSTLKCNRYYQPKGGIPDGYIQGRKCWNRETVQEWIKLTDADLPDYHKKYHTGVIK